MSSTYRKKYLDPLGDTMRGDLNVIGNVSISGTFTTTTSSFTFNDSTVVTSVTSTGEFLTLTVNGSALAIPLYRY